MTSGKPGRYGTAERGERPLSPTGRDRQTRAATTHVQEELYWTYWHGSRAHGTIARVRCASETFYQRGSYLSLLRITMTYVLGEGIPSATVKEALPFFFFTTCMPGYFSELVLGIYGLFSPSPHKHSSILCYYLIYSCLLGLRGCRVS